MRGLGAAANPTTLLLAWGRGDETALDQLIPLVHDELRRLARRHMAGERAGHTLQATALVNEAYLRLIEVNQVRWQNRAHFFAMASRVMRRILVDAARARGYQKRGGGAETVSLDDALLIVKRIFTAAWQEPQIPALMLALVGLIWLYQFCYESRFRELLQTASVRVGAAVFMVLYLCLCASGGGAFIYFQF